MNSGLYLIGTVRVSSVKGSYAILIFILVEGYFVGGGFSLGLGLITIRWHFDVSRMFHLHLKCETKTFVANCKFGVGQYF